MRANRTIVTIRYLYGHEFVLYRCMGPPTESVWMGPPGLQAGRARLPPTSLTSRHATTSCGWPFVGQHLRAVEEKLDFICDKQVRVEKMSVGVRARSSL